MCESTNPEENLNNQNDNVSIENTSDEEFTEDGEAEFDEEVTSEELLEIDNQLDALNLALDAMESKRDMIHSQLLDLLKSNQDVRKEIEEEKQMQVDANDAQSNTKS